ncbi:MAG: amino acid adenylation domain-containing protein, partial [Acidobacteria bacterium]|nr:amino acid adenylation domain-containing protein [Acidobacteriota bacterium]
MLRKIDRLVAAREGNLPGRIDQWIKLKTLKENGDNTHSPIHPRPQLNSVYRPARDSIEATLVRIWKKLLGFADIGIQDDFLALGGDSLKAITVISRIHRETGVNIPVTEFFTQPTIESIAAYIRDNKNKTNYQALEPVEKKEYYPLSSAQLRVYILHRMDTASKGYNIPFIFILSGNIDPAKLAYSFRQLIQRHESLRTGFIMSPQGPAQVIHEHVDFSLAYFESDEKGIPGIFEKFSAPFQLENPPLLRVGLIKIEQTKYILMLEIFHIITDGISFEILMDDFTALYAGHSLPGVTFQYRDYVAWQMRQKNRERRAKEKAYWLEQFADEIPALDLPLDYPRPFVQGFAGSSLSFELAEGTLTALKTLALEQGTTLYPVLLVLYYLFLAKLSNQKDIVVGTPTAGRGHADLEKITGMFVNTLALRNYPIPAKPVGEFLTEVKENTLKAFANQDYQYEELVEEVVINRDLSRNPLFDTMLALQNLNIKEFAVPGFPGLTLTPYHFENKVSHFDLSLTGLEEQNKLVFIFEYNTGLFKKESIERFAVYFQKVVQDLPDLLNKRKNVTVGEIDIIPASEKQQIIYEFNNTAVVYPQNKTIQELFAEQAARTPGYVALHGCMVAWMHDCMDAWMDGCMIAWMHGEVGAGPRVCPSRNVSLTYSQLNEQSDRLAGLLIKKGVLADNIIAIKIERSIEMIIGILGILKAGAAYLPIDPTYPQERINYMLKDSNARILINKSEIRNPKFETKPNDQNTNDQNKNQHSGAVFVLNFENLNFEFVSSFEFRASDLNSSNLAYVIYTSGSTGKPKGVVISQRSVMNFITGITRIIPFTGNDRVLSLTTVSFDIFGLETLVPLVSGSVVVMGTNEEQLNPEMAGMVMEREKISIFQVTPSRLQVIISLPGAAKRLQSLKFLLIGGETLPGPLLEKVRPLVPGKIYNMYGPTETTIWSSVKEVSRGHDLNIGKPIANTVIHILNEAHQVVPVGVTGELYIGGDGLALGYLNSPELTNDRFKRNVISHLSLVISNTKNSLNFTNDQCPMTNDRFYKTGDLGRWLPAGPPAGGASGGGIEFLGR